MRRHRVGFFWAVAVAVLAASGQAAVLLGTSVTGALIFGGTTNYFDPINGDVPTGQGYLNTSGPTVTVAEPAVEFGYEDLGGRITVNLTDSQVLLQEQAFHTAGNTGLYNPFTVTLTDTAFGGASVAPVVDTFPGTTASITGNTLTVSVPAHTQAYETLDLALYNVRVPEPTTLSVAGMAGVSLLGRRRRAR